MFPLSKKLAVVIALAIATPLVQPTPVYAQLLGSLLKDTQLKTEHSLVVKLVPSSTNIEELTRAVFEDSRAYEALMEPALDLLNGVLETIPGVEVTRLVASPVPGWVELNVNSILPLTQIVGLLKVVPLIDVIEENKPVSVAQTNDPAFTAQSVSLGSRYPWNPKVNTAFAKYFAGNARFDAVVIDMGGPIDSVAADTGTARQGYDFIARADTARDGDGRDANPMDPGHSSVCTTPSRWHGIAVASVIGGIANNSRLGYGVFYNNVNNIIHARALGDCGGGQMTDVVAAMIWAAGGSVAGAPPAPSTVRVVNLSLSTPSACAQLEQDAVNLLRSRGIATVASTGNRGTSPESPANCAGAYAVGAINADTGARETYSNYSAGVAVSSSGRLQVVVDSATRDASGTYKNVFKSGTSFSAPIFTGAILRVLSERPTWSGIQAANHIIATSTPITHTSCAGGVCGKGSIDLDRALNGLAALKPPANCSAADVTWKDSVYATNSCRTSLPGGAHGIQATATATSNGKTLGSASYVCSNGTWVINSQKVAPLCHSNCLASSATWSGLNGATCTASHPSLLSNGEQLTVSDTVKSFGGKAVLTCKPGDSKASVVSSTCADIRVYCPATSVEWRPAATLCKSNLPRASEGTESIATSTATSTKGSRTYRCDTATAKWVPLNAGSCNRL